MNKLPTTSGLASVGVYSRGKFSWNLKVCRPFELLRSPARTPSRHNVSSKPSDRAFRAEDCIRKVFDWLSAWISLNSGSENLKNRRKLNFCLGGQSLADFLRRILHEKTRRADRQKRSANLKFYKKSTNIIGLNFVQKFLFSRFEKLEKLNFCSTRI